VARFYSEPLNHLIRARWRSTLQIGHRVSHPAGANETAATPMIPD